MSEIGQKVRELEKARRDAMKVLRAECGKIGHNWRFTNLGPLGHPWFHCTICGASRVELGDDDACSPDAD
jgi:hypothetical protein